MKRICTPHSWLAVIAMAATLVLNNAAANEDAAGAAAARKHDTVWNLSMTALTGLVTEGTTTRRYRVAAGLDACGYEQLAKAVEPELNSVMYSMLPHIPPDSTDAEQYLMETGVAMKLAMVMYKAGFKEAMTITLTSTDDKRREEMCAVFVELADQILTPSG